MKKIRVFHGMTDVAGQGSYAVAGLRKLGVHADMVVLAKNKFAYTDYKSLNISKNPWTYPWSALKILFFALITIPRYNVFHFHFGRSLLPLNLDLPILKLLGKKVFMEYHGSDIRWQFYREKPNYWPEEQLPAASTRSAKTNKWISKWIDGYILHDYELVKHLPTTDVPVYFVPLKIDVNRFIPNYPEIENRRPLIVHAPSDSLIKGSRYVLEAIERLKEKYDFDFELVQNKPQAEALEIFSRADIIADQFFIGCYGVFTVEAMAMGKPVICYISEDMREHFPEELPVQNANIENLEQVIESLIQDAQKRNQVGKESRVYAENYHSLDTVARALLDIYEGKFEECSQRKAFKKVRDIARNKD